jgi:hypothetical protein
VYVQADTLLRWHRQGFLCSARIPSGFELNLKTAVELTLEQRSG